MRLAKLKKTIAALGAIAMLTANFAAPVFAQDPDGSTGQITLYTDPRTGQLFSKPGRGRVRLGTYIPTDSVGEIERRVEQKTSRQVKEQTDAMKSEMEERQAQQQQWNATMAEQVSSIAPAANDYGDRWFKKISLGVLVYADYRFYSHTGFGPQFLTQQVWPGPGNNAFNAFDITRTYLDFKFTPTEDFMLRVTPNMYLSTVTPTCAATGAARGSQTCRAASGDAFGRGFTAASGQADGNLAFRLKYAYIDYTTFFKKVAPVDWAKEDKFTFGQQQNPLVDWEENLYGYRYVNLIPWNYLSLSSTQVGFAMKGPIKFHELQYADYDAGVYDNASFHALEQANNKQVMGRVTVNPFGVKSRYDGFGITGFYDLAFANRAVDNQFVAPQGTANRTVSAKNAHSTRVAALMHYTAQHWAVAGEWDYGHNAFTSGNLFSGSGPADEFVALATPAAGHGFGTGGNFATPYTQYDTLTAALQNNGQAIQQGWDFFGHVDIPRTPFQLFGLFQQFLPNTRAEKNPNDFQRYAVGINWTINKYFRMAIDSQSIMYYHDQFTFPGTQLAPFIGRANPAANHGRAAVADTPFAVPRDTHAFFLNLEFRY